MIMIMALRVLDDLMSLMESDGSLGVEERLSKAKEIRDLV